jgi:hypothetical protein
MRRTTHLVAAAAVAAGWWLLLTAQVPAADGPDPLEQAVRAIGAARLSRLHVSGFGSAQGPAAGAVASGGAREVVRRFEIDADLSTGRAVSEWHFPGRTERVTQSGGPVWRTPHGFLAAASATESVSRATPRGLDVTFTNEGRRIVGTIGSDGLVDRIHTWLGTAETGFVEVETVFRDYEPHGDVRFPRHITEYRDGVLTSDLWVSRVRATVVPARLRLTSFQSLVD